MPKQLRRRRRVRRNGRSKLSSVPRFDTLHPERWLSYGMRALPIGLTTGALGTGTAAFNLGLLNTNSDTSPLEIQPGTGISNRAGMHIILTRCQIRAYVSLTMSARCRVMIFANPRDNQNTSSAKTNAQLTAIVEASPFLRTTEKSFGANGTIGPVDWLADPASDYTVLYDKMYGCGDNEYRTALAPQTAGVGIRYQAQIVPVEIDLDLMLPVMYNNNGNPTTGDLIIYIASTCANADTADTLGTPACVWFGSIRVQYVDALNLEAIGRSIRDFIDEASNTLDHMSKSTLFKYGQMALPYVTKAFGLGL